MAKKKTDIVRALRDPRYRRGLSEEQLAQLPDHPAGLIELSDDDLRVAGGRNWGGGGGGPVTTAPGCTAYTFLGWRACGCGIATTAPTCTQYTFKRWRACCP